MTFNCKTVKKLAGSGALYVYERRKILKCLLILLIVVVHSRTHLNTIAQRLVVCMLSLLSRMNFQATVSIYHFKRNGHFCASTTSRATICICSASTTRYSKANLHPLYMAHSVTLIGGFNDSFFSSVRENWRIWQIENFRGPFNWSSSRFPGVKLVIWSSQSNWQDGETQLFNGWSRFPVSVTVLLPLYVWL